MKEKEGGEGWRRRREEERGGGGKVGGAHSDLDHTYPELSVSRATLVHTLKNQVWEDGKSNSNGNLLVKMRLILRLWLSHNHHSHE